MTDTKKSLLKIGAIASIVIAVLTILGIIPVIVTCNKIINENAVVEILKEDEQYVYVPVGENDYYLEYYEDGNIIKITKQEVQQLANITRIIINVVAGLITLFAIANLIIANLLLKSVKHNKKCTGKIIALMILSFIISNFLTATLMIIALCIADKKPTLENIYDYVIE